MFYSKFKLNFVKLIIIFEVMQYGFSSRRLGVSSFRRKVRLLENVVQGSDLNTTEQIYSNPGRGTNKCPIWVPVESVSKYKFAVKKQIDASKQMQSLEVCCPGYVGFLLNGTDIRAICRPFCENCANGFCKAPGECQCYEEFVRNDNGDCVFSCPLGCLNGQCFLDGTCQCNIGFKLDETRKFCRPICSTGCGQNPAHNCTEPEICACAKGYQLTDNGCKPVCQPSCGLGGRCVEPNKCECMDGYDLKEGVCQANCYQNCENGVCYSNNRCICNSGFYYHELSTMCVPK